MSSIIPSLAVQGIVSILAAPSAPISSVARVTVTEYQLFPAVTSSEGSQERFITNPNAAGSIWVTFLDTTPAAINGEGSFEIPPGSSWVGSVLNQVRCVFTVAAMKITHGERR